MADLVGNQNTESGLGENESRAQDNRAVPVTAVSDRKPTTTTANDAHNYSNVVRRRRRCDVTFKVVGIVAELFVGAALVYVGFRQYKVYEQQAGILAKQTEIAANQDRAWIAPIKMDLTGLVNSATKITYDLHFGNTGHSPATEVVFNDDEKDVRRGPIERFYSVSDPNSQDWIDNETCGGLKDRQNTHVGWPAVFPSSDPIYTIPLKSNAVPTERVLNGDDIQFAKGCFRYKSGKLPAQYVSYCFYLANIGSWRFYPCPFGNAVFGENPADN